jgi:uncharacterized protein
MKGILLLALLSVSYTAGSQTYADSITMHRQAYKMEFINEERSPLKADDTAYLRFYKPDARYRVTAVVTLTPDAPAFDIPTHSGKRKFHRKYADVVFRIGKRTYKLEVYQSLIKKDEYKDHLFLPFNDLTNYKETYAGGRYIDLSLKDIKNNTILIDFNKAYNPYCAYASGYNCPIPPPANNLKVSIRAGEKLYGKDVTGH